MTDVHCHSWAGFDVLCLSTDTFGFGEISGREIYAAHREAGLTMGPSAYWSAVSGGAGSGMDVLGIPWSVIPGHSPGYLTNPYYTGPHATGTFEGGIAVFAGVVGFTGSKGWSKDTAGKTCKVDTACFQIGLGAFAGPTGDLSASLGGPLMEGSETESIGLFGEAAAIIWGVLGSVDAATDMSEVGASTGVSPLGVGSAGGLQFCRVRVYDCKE